MEIISILAPGFSFFLALKLRFRLESLLKSAGQEQLLRMLSGWEDKVIITTCTTLSQELHHQHHYNSQGNYSVLKNPIPPVDLQQWIGKMFGKMTFFLSSKGGWIHSRKWVSKSTLMMMILSVRFVPLGIVWCLLVEIWPARDARWERPVFLLEGGVGWDTFCQEIWYWLWLAGTRGISSCYFSRVRGAGVCQNTQAWMFAVSTIILPWPVPSWSQANSDQPTSHDLPRKKVSTCSKPP